MENGDYIKFEYQGNTREGTVEKVQHNWVRDTHVVILKDKARNDECRSFKLSKMKLISCIRP